MKIKLDLTRHCIETETKSLYNRSVSKYFKAGTDKERGALEEQIEFLRNVLETLDLVRLRGAYKELAGNSDDEVMLTTDDQGKIIILINGKKIDPYKP